MTKTRTRKIRARIRFTDKIYDRWEDMAKAMKLSKWESDKLPRGCNMNKFNGREGTVLAIKYYSCDDKFVVGMELDGGEQIIMGIDGLEFI